MTNQHSNIPSDQITAVIPINKNLEHLAKNEEQGNAGATQTTQGSEAPREGVTGGAPQGQGVVKQHH